MMDIVLDTNALLMSLSKRGDYYNVWRSLIDGEYVLCYSNEILEEYEEILTQKVGKEIAGNVIQAILDLPNKKQVQVFYHWHLITADPDDDKFVDCAIKVNAKYIVTEDRHYKALKDIDFPKVDVISLDEFSKELNDIIKERAYSHN